MKGKRKEKRNKEGNGRERESMRKREGKESSSFSLRSMEFRMSEFIGSRMEVHLLDESYAWVSKSQDFTKDSSEEFGKSKVSGLGSVHETS